MSFYQSVPKHYTWKMAQTLISFQNNFMGLQDSKDRLSVLACEVMCVSENACPSVDHKNDAFERTRRW